MNKIAIIDLGTNTCNLLISEYNQTRYNILYQGKEVVKMGKGGINKKLILDDGIHRAVRAIKNHKQIIEEYNAEKTIAIATSAVRDASNKDIFCETILNETGITLDVISGDKEAELIFNGVLLAFDKQPGNSLILDIGGGSNEFILCKNQQVIWKHSFPLGVARIMDKFQISDPISPEEIISIRNYFEEKMEELWTTVKGKPIENLIGCSGAFDTIVDLIDETTPGTKQRKRQKVSIYDFQKIYQRIIVSTIAKREQMKGLESLRVEMIIPAVILIDLIIQKLKIPQIVQTDYALREGVLSKMVLFN